VGGQRVQRLGVLLLTRDRRALAAWIITGGPPPGMQELSPARFGPLADDALITRGIWQYAHYYEPGE
jgi:hypothetical protein